MGGLLGHIFGTLTGATRADRLRQENIEFHKNKTLLDAALKGEAPPEYGDAALEAMAKMGGKHGKEFMQILNNMRTQQERQQPKLQVPQLTPPPEQNASFGPTAGGGIPMPPPPPGMVAGPPLPEPTPGQMPQPVVNGPMGRPHLYNPRERGQAAVEHKTPEMENQIRLGLQQRQAMMEFLTKPADQGGLGIDINTLSVPQRTALMGVTIPEVPFHALSPGQVGVQGGKRIEGPPQVVTTAPGAVTTLVPTVPPPPGSQPTSQPVAAPPALMDESARDAVSAAQQVAEKHGLPFDPAKDPRNPLAQIPTRYHKEFHALVAEQKMDPAMRASMLASRATMEGIRQIQESNARNQRADQSYKFHVTELDKVSKPITDLLARMGRLEDTLAQNTPQADALVAPELLTVMAGGQGSGLRMNEAEIARIIGGRSVWENLKASINRWQLDPKAATSITPAQRKQIRSLVNEVGTKLRAKQGLLDDYQRSLLSAEDPLDHRRGFATLKQSLTAIDQGKAPQGGQFKYTATGPNGEKVGSNDGVTWQPIR